MLSWEYTPARPVLTLVCPPEVFSPLRVYLKLSRSVPEASRVGPDQVVIELPGVGGHHPVFRIGHDRERPAVAGGHEGSAANAVHAMVFNSEGFVVDVNNWDMVNQDGTPCGPNGPCTITVDAGMVLWVTWHLTFQGIGSPSAGISDTCPGNVTISATGTLKDSSGGTLATCTATATGYLKK